MARKFKITERFGIFEINGREMSLCQSVYENCFIDDNTSEVCDLGNITAIHKDGLVKVIGIGVFEAPEPVKDEYALYRCVHKILDAVHRCMDDQEIKEVPLDRWYVDKKYLFNEKDKYYRLA